MFRPSRITKNDPVNWDPVNWSDQATHDTQPLVIIGQRLSTVEDCDLLIWLEKGRIKMTGPQANHHSALKMGTENA
jgi:ABC-type transport system involved in Fe-S cluster assembly fused permease/ATPase subunit